MVNKKDVAYTAMEVLVKATMSDMDMEHYNAFVSGVISEYACCEAMIASGQKFEFIKR